MNRNEYDVIVVGGGPAGLSAAAEAAQYGASVLVAEKTATCGRKLLISGSGRCNITNTIKDTKEFISVVTNGRFLYQALNAVGTADIISFFNSKGLKTVVEHGTKVFPDTGGSADVLKILMQACARAGVEFICGSAVTDILTDDGTVSGVVIGDKTVKCRAAIIATGGMSYPKTGSDGDGYAMAQRGGHWIITPRPVLVPAYTDCTWIKDAEGISLRDVGLHLMRGQKKAASARGDLVFTDRGVSGPAVYDISRLSAAEVGDTLAIDLFPDEAEDALDSRLAQDMNASPKKLIRNIIDGYVPSSLVAAVFAVAGVADDAKAANMKASDRKKLTLAMKAMAMPGIRFAGFERAVVTAGGVDTREIDGRTMMSKKVRGLFFAGEVIDVEGPTGGYNLQICWSTGRLAGMCAARMIKN